MSRSVIGEGLPIIGFGLDISKTKKFQAEAILMTTNVSPQNSDHHDPDVEEKKAIRRLLIESRIAIVVLAAIVVAHFVGLY
jgi:hypothetical protein